MTGTRELIEHLFVFGMDVMTSAVNATTKAITAQLGDAAHGQYVDSDEAEWWGWTGFQSRPAAPTQTGGQQSATACQAIAIRHSTHDKIVATRDLRWSAINQDLQPGDASLHASGQQASAGNGRVTARADGSLEMLSTIAIRLGTTSPSDFVARASKVDGDFTTISNAATTYTSAMTSLPTFPISTPAQAVLVLNTIVPALNAFMGSLSFNPTGSTLVKISS